MAPVVGLVCGMQAESRMLGPYRIDRRIALRCTGARPRLTEIAARELIGLGCRVLVSWGVAGGLDPTLEPGDMPTFERVFTPGVGGAGADFALSPHVGKSRRGGALLGSETMVLLASEKARLHRETGASAVDMETHILARMAAEAGLPLLAARAIGDPAGRDVPPFVVNALTPEGLPRILPVLAGLARRPLALPSLLRLKRDTDAGLMALARCANGDFFPKLFAEFGD